MLLNGARILRVKNQGSAKAKGGWAPLAFGPAGSRRVSGSKPHASKHHASGHDIGAKGGHSAAARWEEGVFT